MNGHNRSPLATAGGYLEHKRGTTTVDQVGLNLWIDQQGIDQSEFTTRKKTGSDRITLASQV